MQILTAAELNKIRETASRSEGVLLNALERVQKALPDPGKLEALADWFDARQATTQEPGTEVQDDLRMWGARIRQARHDTGVEQAVDLLTEALVGLKWRADEHKG